MRLGVRWLDSIHFGGERNDVKQCVKQCVANLLHHIRCTAVTHERCAGVTTNHCTRKRRRNVCAAPSGLRGIHALVKAAEKNQRSLFLDEFTNAFVVSLCARNSRHSKVAGQAQLVFEEVAQATGIGLGRDNSKARRTKEVLRHRTPQIPDRFDRGVTLALNEGLRIKTQQLAQTAQEFSRAVQTNRRLQIGPLHRFAEQPTELAVHADVDLGVGQVAHFGQMRSERERQINFSADAFN